MTNPKDLVGAKKAPLEGVPAAGAIFSAPAHAVGHEKYGPFNWRLQPVQVMSYIGAVQRHIAAYVDGQDLAEDTQVHHLAHAIAGLNIVADSMGLGILIDNRPPKGPAADMLRAQDRSEAFRPVEMPHATVAEVAHRLRALPLAGCPACGHFTRHIESQGGAWCKVCMDDITDGDPRQVGPCY